MKREAMREGSQQEEYGHKPNHENVVTNKFFG